MLREQGGQPWMTGRYVQMGDNLVASQDNQREMTP